MKKMAVLSAVALSLPVVFLSAQADDYFYADKDSKSGLCYETWAPVNQTKESPLPREAPKAGNDYWVVSGFSAGTNTASATAYVEGPGTASTRSYTMPGTLNIGSPATKTEFPSKAGTVRKSANHKVTLSTDCHWYNGILMVSQRYGFVLKGSLAVHDEEGATHALTLSNNGLDGASSTRVITVSSAMSSESESVNVSLVCSATTSSDCLTTLGAYGIVNGSNAGYKGTFSSDTSYIPFVFGGSNPLGDPNTPNPAALTICDNGCFAVDDTGTQNPARGIRFVGDIAYLTSAAASLTETSVLYPISKAEGVNGKLIKVGVGTNTLNCAYSAGDIEIQTGKLIIGADATFPVGQKFKVDDGAVLEFIAPVDGVTVETVGTGTVIYPEGYRLNADNVWEVKVSAVAEGDGTAEGDWTVRGVAFDCQATPGAGIDFLKWSGDLAATVGAPSRAFSPTITVVTEVPVNLTAHFGTLVQPQDITDEDGTTFVFADRQLTVTVPENVTNVRDYSTLISDGWVTNVIKKGVGTLTLAAAPGYVGDFTIDVGAAIMNAVGAVGANGVGVVRIANGAALWNDVANTQIATGKKVYFEGTGPDGKGALRSISNDNAYGIAGDYVMTGDGRWNLTAESGLRLDMRNSTFDFAGRALNMAGLKWSSSYIANCVLTNGDENSAATISIVGYQKLNIQNCAFGGGPRNRIQGSNGGYLVLTGTNRGDWTLKGDTTRSYLNAGTALVNGENHTNDQWCGTIAWDTTSSQYGPFMINENQKDRAVTLSGPITNTTSNPFVGLYSGYLNIFSKVNTYSGRFYVKPLDGATITPTLCLYDDAVFTCGASHPVYVQTDFVFRMAENTSFKLPRFQQSGVGRFEVYGGPDGEKDCGRAVVAGIEKTVSNTNVLYVDSPVAVTGLTSIAAGTLALADEPRTAAQLPVFSNLVFAAETTLDMGGNDLTVPNLTGFPTIANPGALTIAGTWTIDQADILAGKCLDLGDKSLTFADGAKIVIVNRTTSSQQSFVIAQATGGIFGSPVTQGWRRNVEIKDGKLTLTARGLILVVQ